MAETSLDKELDNMEEVTEGSNAVTKDAKPGEKMDSSGGGAAKVVDVTSDSMEGAKGTKMQELLLLRQWVKHLFLAPSQVTHLLKWRT